MFFAVSGNFIASIFIYRKSFNENYISKIATANAANLFDSKFAAEANIWGRPDDVDIKSLICEPYPKYQNDINNFSELETTKVWGKDDVTKRPDLPNKDKKIESFNIGEIKVSAYKPIEKKTNIVKNLEPLWKLNSVAVSDQITQKHFVAIIIDDLGIDKKRTSKIINLPAVITTSFLTYTNNLQDAVDLAKQKGHEIMLHVPMEPKDRGYDPGPDALMVSMNKDEIKNNLDAMLNKIDGYVGINNHMGSKFTSDSNAMNIVINDLSDRGLLFIDSMTSAGSIGLTLADKKGVPSAPRNIFLDNLPGEEYALRQLKKLEDMALTNGYAVGIGHPRDGTITALAKWLENVNEKDIAVVPVSYIVTYRNYPSEFALK